MKTHCKSADAWLIWQLADSAFPSGGFAHSAGLEAAWHHGEINGRVDLTGFLESSLSQFAHASLPFFKAAHANPGRLVEFDLQCDAFISNHVANRASRLQGRAFHGSAKRIFSGDLSGLPALPPCGHFAPVFGAVTDALGLGLGDGAEIFCFQHLRGLIAAAVRLGIVGPMEGQTMQHRLGNSARAIFAECGAIEIGEAAQTAPLIEMWQGAQDRLYSRLFQS